MYGKLSREISETLRVKQGNIKSSDNYKIYANPLLDTLDSANLGVLLGPINCGFSSCADDLHLMTDTQSKMQALLDIAFHYVLVQTKLDIAFHYVFVQTKQRSQWLAACQI